MGDDRRRARNGPRRRDLHARRIGNYTNTTQALLDPRTLTWSATGSGKKQANEEGGFTLLPDGDVLAVGLMPRQDRAETYDPTTGAWRSAGTVPVPVVYTQRSFPQGLEIGPQVLRPNGSVLVVGVTGRNAVYNSRTGAWSPGPSFPVIGGKRFGTADGAAAVLPDGDVLIDASPGLYKPPSHFFVFNDRTLTRVPDPPNAAHLASNWGYMLDLPTGQVLLNDRFGHMEVYTAGGSAAAGWRPVIRKAPRIVTGGGTYTVTGLQLNGLTQGAYYGDDFQSATNYPLVRLSYGNGRVVYAHTFHMSSMAVTPGLRSTARCRLPAGTPAGQASLVVVANGVAAAPVAVAVG